MLSRLMGIGWELTSGPGLQPGPICVSGAHDRDLGRRVADPGHDADLPLGCEPAQSTSDTRLADAECGGALDVWVLDDLAAPSAEGDVGGHSGDRSGVTHDPIVTALSRPGKDPRSTFPLVRGLLKHPQHVKNPRTPLALNAWGASLPSALPRGDLHPSGQRRGLCPFAAARSRRRSSPQRQPPKKESVATRRCRCCREALGRRTDRSTAAPDGFCLGACRAAEPPPTTPGE